MGLLADASAWMIQRSAGRTARYGDVLYFTGTDLPEPDDVLVPTRHGDVRCEVYRPADALPGAPAYVHLHGGAFLMRHPRMDDFWARLVAAEVGAVVVNVDYDVAPQVRYPVAQEQAHDVLAWVCGDGAQVLDVDAGRVVVGGFSAGGNLAASAALQARDLGSCRPVLQLLGVPSLDVAEDPHDKVAPSGTAMIGPGLLTLVRRTYFKDASRRAEAYASPLRADDLAGLAPALVVTAERDVLRAEGDRYAERLTAAGVRTRHLVVPDRDHYFLDGDRAAARRVLDVMVEEMRSATGPPA